ncbi:putative ABC transporter, AAA+ ATPase domain, ABC-2 type transporter [Helianthus annuus]|nr:putative ABC transporter, AAA+ ATPase domain, ABC-2 type transporter [Helianthus annuus]KAJ0562565.1 putative ABC transporter, AAA+ ATPase domain, ABC-2 type transporter [Helianthus annuus]KAJ0727939.1 putative ABC transporter, AAA+ ATPase domain, ABC-2 type transporter [Helianthus annuus]KAJ0730720.1 putative ABC transporter, AAA+ ATPase domain, ABC-2 type transporter [Helianthus annuus]
MYSTTTTMEEEEEEVPDTVKPDHDHTANHHIQTHAHSKHMALYPIRLKFEKVVYKVILKGAREKVILNGVTGMVCPGEMLAMLGPSGSGKTTLLTALGGRLTGKLAGKITYNNQPFCGSTKRRTGFVTQDDVLYPHLTVTETLLFTAMLRLPNSLTRDEKVNHVDRVIAELGLTRCQNSMIGGPLFRGISGGEKKRVSIGQEMLINPSLLLLDEPTSGLDSTTAQRILTTIKRLATGGRTVVTTIHQPSTRIYHMFDKLVLLSEGSQIYYGPASTALEYFSSIGFSTSVTVNPADMLLDLANGSHVQSEQWYTSWWYQFTVLLIRGLRERRFEAFNKLRIFQVVSVAILAGLLWWHTPTSHIADRIAMLFFFSVFWGFYPLYNAVFTFPQERRMLIKERSSGMYRLSSYFLARTIGDLPLELALPTAFTFILYWMGGLKPDPSTFILSWLVVIYTVLVAQSLGLAFGAILMDVKQATTLASVTTLVFLIAGGYYVQQIPPFIVWLKYLSYSYYCYKLLLGVQYHENDLYECSKGVYCKVADFQAVKSVGLNNLAMDLSIMALMLIGYRFVAYLALHKVR